jgi:hypothetical protein
MLLYIAVYPGVDAALADLEALEHLGADQIVGAFDAAVIDESGAGPQIVRRLDRPRARIIPELLGAGRLPRFELRHAARELRTDQAALVAVGDPTTEDGFAKAITPSARIVKRWIDDVTDAIADELREVFKN